MYVECSWPSVDVDEDAPIVTAPASSLDASGSSQVNAKVNGRIVAESLATFHRSVMSCSGIVSENPSTYDRHASEFHLSRRTGRKPHYPDPT